MVVGDFNAVRVAIFPYETDAPLIVDPDTVLPLAVALQLLEAIARNRAQVVEACRSIQHLQLPLRQPLESLKSFHALASEQAFRIRGAERLDHMLRV